MNDEKRQHIYYNSINIYKRTYDVQTSQVSFGGDVPCTDDTWAGTIAALARIRRRAHVELPGLRCTTFTLALDTLRPCAVLSLSYLYNTEDRRSAA